MPATPAEPTPGKARILLVDDHPLMRRGLAALIDNEPDLAVCAEAGNRRATLEAVARHGVDLAIVDLSFENGEDGLDLVKALKVRSPPVPALVLSMHPEARYGERALRAGARGFIGKQEPGEAVLAAIRGVLAGRIYMSEALQRLLAERYVGGRALETSSPTHTLSDRELQVFRLIGQGRTTRQIAATLNRSIKTIESHLEHIKNKLGLMSSAELAHRATQWVDSSRIS